jgi:hypothetical protein
MIRTILFLASSVFLFYACNKIEIPEPQQTDFSAPVFDLAINVDGMELPFTAGENCIRLDTDYDQDYLDIYSFNGTFKHDFDCDAATDPLALKFEIRDNKVRNSTAGISEDAIRLGVYDYFEGYENVLGYQVMIQNILDLGEIEITTSTGETIEPITNGVNVELSSAVEWIKVENRDFIQDELVSSRKYYLRDSLSQYFAGSQFLFADSAGIETTVISIENNSSLPDHDFTYVWDDGSEQNFITVILGDKPVTRCVEIFDQDGILYEECLNLSIANILPLIIPSYSISSFFSVPNIGISEELETVIVEYTNSEGDFYSSKGVNANSNFEILDIQPFEENDAGLESSKLEIKFDCILESPFTGERVEISNTTGTTAVSYPK